MLTDPMVRSHNKFRPAKEALANIRRELLVHTALQLFADSEHLAFEGVFGGKNLKL